MSSGVPTPAGPVRPGDAALWRATTAAVAVRGYRETSVADILAGAGIARSTFYARYPSKERCFTDAVGEIVRETLDAVRDAIPELGSERELLQAPIAALLQAVADHPEAARAALIEVHAAGEGADEHRRAAQALLARMVRRALGGRRGHGDLATDLATGICGGIEALVARAVREDRTAALPALAPALADWAAAFRPLLEPGAPALPAWAPTPSRRRGQAPGTLVPVGPSGRRGLPPGPKRESRDAVAQTVRDRLLDATVLVAADDGYDALTVAAIVARAQTSRRSFYEHFTSIAEAFDAALRAGVEAITAATLIAYAARRDPAAAVVAGVDRLTAFLAEEPGFARAALLQAPAAGVPALAVRDETLEAFAGMLADAHRRLGATEADAERHAALGAGGVLALCAEHLRTGDPSTLTARVPVLAAVALAPVVAPDALVAAIDVTGRTK